MYQELNLYCTSIIEEKLNAMDLSKSIKELEREVYDLQQAARRMMEDGTPIYQIDYVPKSSTKIGKLAEVILGINDSTRTEEFLRRILEKYGV